MSTRTRYRRRAPACGAALVAIGTGLGACATPAAAAPPCSIVDDVLVCDEDPLPVAGPAPETPPVPPPMECAVVDLALVCVPVGQETPPAPDPVPVPDPDPAPVPPPSPEPSAEPGPGSLGSEVRTTLVPLDPCAEVPTLVVWPEATDVPFACEAPTSVFRGDASGGLHPERVLTRGQAATALHRLLESTDLAGASSGRDWFDDDDGTVHEAAINRMADFGILFGTTGGTAAAGSSVTGSQLASMLHRTLVHTGLAGAPAPDHPTAVEELARAGIPPFPTGPLTRIQAAMALEGLLDLLTS